MPENQSMGEQKGPTDTEVDSMRASVVTASGYQAYQTPFKGFGKQTKVVPCRRVVPSRAFTRYLCRDVLSAAL